MKKRDVSSFNALRILTLKTVLTVFKDVQLYPLLQNQGFKFSVSK